MYFGHKLVSIIDFPALVRILKSVYNMHGRRFPYIFNGAINMRKEDSLLKV